MGGELGLVADIGLLACRGIFEQTDESSQREIRLLAERCRQSSATLVTAGLFLSCLSETGLEAKSVQGPHELTSRIKLSAAWESSGKTSDFVLRTLIFAFFAARDVSGLDERQIRQLEGGRAMARMFGGADRSDHVGQTALGLWFEVQLKSKFLEVMVLM